jgi:hypothetical protein
MQHVWINLQETPYSPDEVVTNKNLMKKNKNELIKELIVYIYIIIIL